LLPSEGRLPVAVWRFFSQQPDRPVQREVRDIERDFAKVVAGAADSPDKGICFSDSCAAQLTGQQVFLDRLQAETSQVNQGALFQCLLRAMALMEARGGCLPQ
jgi:hypothetical protein